MRIYVKSIKLLGIDIGGIEFVLCSWSSSCSHQTPITGKATMIKSVQRLGDMCTISSLKRCRMMQWSVSISPEIIANKRASIYRRSPTVDTPNPASPLVIPALCLDCSFPLKPPSFSLYPCTISTEVDSLNTTLLFLLLS